VSSHANVITMTEPSKTIYHVGMRLRHHLTGREIKLLLPVKCGWSVEFVSAQRQPGQGAYTAYLGTDTLNKFYVDMGE